MVPWTRCDFALKQKGSQYANQGKHSQRPFLPLLYGLNPARQARDGAVPGGINLGKTQFMAQYFY